MSERTECIVGNLIAFVGICWMVGCASTANDFNKIPEYQKTITLVEYPSHEKYLETKVTLWKFISSKYDRLHCHGDYFAKRSKIEEQVRREIRDEGLYINRFEEVEDKHGDSYLICEASPKPTFRKDWQEFKKHQELHEYMFLNKKYGTNTNVKCECRYCTSGLHHKYWYP